MTIKVIVCIIFADIRDVYSLRCGCKFSYPSLDNSIEVFKFWISTTAISIGATPTRGCHLGPLFFIIFVNDIVKILNWLIVWCTQIQKLIPDWALWWEFSQNLYRSSGTKISIFCAPGIYNRELRIESIYKKNVTIFFQTVWMVQFGSIRV